MIIVFGLISMDIHLRVEDVNDAGPRISAAYDDMIPGGKAASQALAAARSGAKVALVGKVGDDEFSTTILNQLRREGVMTSGVAKADKPTGITIWLDDGAGRHKAITAGGANEDIDPGQVPDEILDEKHFLLLQTEIRAEVNTTLLARAKARGATTIMNLAPAIDLSQKALDNLDYLIVNKPEAEKLAQKIGVGADSEPFKLARALSKQGKLNCIVTMSERGAVACTTDGQGWEVKALPIEKLVDKAGADDAYSGTLAACLQAGMALPRAMKRAGIAASLACTKKGAMPSIPYLTDIDERINDIEDPVQIRG